MRASASPAGQLFCVLRFLDRDGEQVSARILIPRPRTFFPLPSCGWLISPALTHSPGPNAWLLIILDSVEVAVLAMSTYQALLHALFYLIPRLSP